MVIDTAIGRGLTAFVRKALAEQQRGSTVVLVLPADLYLHHFLEAGAVKRDDVEIRSLGRVKFLDPATGEAFPRSLYCLAVILRGVPQLVEKPLRACAEHSRG